ncbi:MAG: iron ABC transporter permease [Actinomycetota bacterium]|nr:iron ABC transporter permease [Actinomycetota bacterium]
MSAATTVAAGPAIGTRLRPRWLLLGVGGVVAAGLLGIFVGPVSLGVRGVLVEMIDRIPFVDASSGLSARDSAILWEIRFPRMVLGGLVGATLALAGAAYQGVFRNPLADPYLLGAAAGAGLGATLVIAYGPGREAWPVDPVPMAAFAGALFGVGAAYLLGRSATRTRSSLILAGVAIASFLTAIQTYLQQRESDTLREVYTWILGQLGTVGWDEVVLILPYTALGAVTIVLHRRLLDVMSLGDDEADSLGVRAARVRLIVVTAASLATAAAVAVSGLIGFVGIIVPHTVRLIVGSSYRLVLPLSLLFGASFLIATDVIARTLLAPAEMPIGVITAFFGAPFFLFVLRRSRR